MHRVCTRVPGRFLMLCVCTRVSGRLLMHCLHMHVSGHLLMLCMCAHVSGRLLMRCAYGSLRMPPDALRVWMCLSTAPGELHNARRVGRAEHWVWMSRGGQRAYSTRPAGWRALQQGGGWGHL